MQKITYM